MTFKRLIAGSVAGAWLLASTLPVFAININSNTTWTDTGTGITINDSLSISSGVTLRIINSNGIDGGNLILNLGNGQSFILKGILDMSAIKSGGSGGILKVNDLGTNTTIDIIGKIMSNGIGTGAGGMITLNSDRLDIDRKSVIEAKGGATGLGGVVNLKRSSGNITLDEQSIIDTSGIAGVNSNLITIEADGVNLIGNLIADGTGDSTGGQVMMVSNNGRIKIYETASISAQGEGKGSGGTLDLRGAKGSNSLAFSECSGSNCSGSDILLIHKKATVNIASAKGEANGTLKIGRATNGRIEQDFNGKTGTDYISGVGTLKYGDDSGKTTSLILENFDNTQDVQKTNPNMHLISNGYIYAYDNNDFGLVDLQANGLTYLFEKGDVNINSYLNTSTSDNYIVSYDGSVLGKKGKDVDVTTKGNLYAIAGDSSRDRNSYIFLNMDVDKNATLYAAGMINDGKNAYDTENSILTSGNVDGNFSAINTSGGATVGNIYMGTGYGELHVGGNTTFNTAKNIQGKGSWNGTVAGTAGENIYFYATSGDFKSAGVTANGSVGNKWFAYRNLAIYTPKGSITGSGFTSNNAAGGIRLKAGDYNNLDKNLYIDIKNVHSDGFTDLLATGDTLGNGLGNSINVSGNFYSKGAIVATGLNDKNKFDYATGKINLTVTQGDLITGMIMGKGGNINLTVNKGSIGEDKARAFNPLSTIMADNNTTVTLTATGQATSNVATSVNILGAGGNLIVKVDGDTNGNGSGSSVEIEGEVEGNVTVTDTTGGAPSGSVSTP